MHFKIYAYTANIQHVDAFTAERMWWGGGRVCTAFGFPFYSLSNKVLVGMVFYQAHKSC